MRTIDPDPNTMHQFLGIPYYGVAILTYSIGFFLSMVIIVITGISLMTVIACAGAFSSVLPMVLVDKYARWDSASSSRVQFVIRRGMVLYPLGFTLAFLMGLFIEFSLSFLGLGMPPSTPSLGSMIVRGMDFAGAWWVISFPLGILLVATGAFLAIVFSISRDFIPSSQAHLLESLSIQAGAPAGFRIRLAAWSLDFFLQLILVVIMNLIIIILGQSSLVVDILSVVCLVVIVWIYVFSPSKRHFGLFVLRPNGSRVGLGRRIFRSMVLTFTLGMGHSMIIFRQDKRGLHDLLADTVVVRREEGSRDVQQ